MLAKFQHYCAAISLNTEAGLDKTDNQGFGKVSILFFLYFLNAKVAVDALHTTYLYNNFIYVSCALRNAAVVG